jgi:predicted MFS family arabinose efflux permease
MTAGAAVSRNGGTSPLRDGEFRAIWLGRLISTLGDQLARVALALIAFSRTGSAGLTAVTYALTYLPAVIGGPLLGGPADRYPRRTVAVCCDIARGALIAAAAIPVMPFGALIPLIFAVSLLEPPSDAARSALMANVLSGARYMSAMTVTLVSGQLATLLGFAAGGVLAAVLGPRTAMLLDAASFAFSAIVTWLGVRHRAAARAVSADTVPAASPAGSASPAGTGGGIERERRAGPRGTIRVIAADPVLSRLAAFTMIVCCLVAPESLAAPYAASLGGGAPGTGMFLAAFPVGFTLGGILMTRIPAPSRLLGLIAPAFALASVPLICFTIHPSLPVSIGLWTLSGLLSAPVITVNAAFVRVVPDDSRGAAGALMSSVLGGGQGLLMAAAGGIAEILGLPGTVAVFGVAVAVFTVLTSVGWRAARAAAVTALAEPAGAAGPARAAPVP